MTTDFITYTTQSDLDFIYHLFDEAIAYQKRNNYPVWPGYDREVLKNDIDNMHQYKLVSNGEIGYIFSVCYSDKIIWRERDQADAIYLHRMVVNPKFKGQKQFRRVLKWIRNHCMDKNLKLIRIDTWANNRTIIEYYKSFGFSIVGYFSTPDSEELPIQQRNNEIVLLELQLK